MRCLLVLVLVVLVGCGSTPTTKQTKRVGSQTTPDSLVGKPLPDFTMTDAFSGDVVTNADLKGKVVLLDFWASWCGPCLAAAPSMQQLHKEFSDQGLVVIGANVSEQNPSAEAVRAYAQKHKYDYRFTWKADDLKQAVGVRFLPTMLVVDRTGTVRVAQVGGRADLATALTAAIQPLLKE